MDLTGHSQRVPSLCCSILRGVSRRLVNLTGLIGRITFTRANKMDEMKSWTFIIRQCSLGVQRKNMSRFWPIITECSYTKREDFHLMGSHAESLGVQNQMFRGKVVSKWSSGLGNFEPWGWYYLVSKRRVPTIQRESFNIWEERNPELYHCEHLKTRLNHTS